MRAIYSARSSCRSAGETLEPETFTETELQEAGLCLENDELSKQENSFLGLHRQRSGCRFLLESYACLVAAAVFKTVEASHGAWWVRFLHFPPNCLF